jgi:hypothetical protein
MSAIEAFPDVIERRSAERLRPASAIRVMIGRGCGILLDLSRGGMRVRHTFAATRGSQVRVTLNWQSERFFADAEVLSSRVAALGGAESGATVFESRFRFVRLSDHSESVLERVLSAISSRELRAWVANLHGWSDEARAGTSPEKAAFIRYRLIGQQWQTKWTHDTVQPANGFLLPASMNPQDLARLCETYSRADEDGRHLIRLMADEAVKEAR